MRFICNKSFSSRDGGNELVTVEKIINKKTKIGIVGLGYVGLPLAAAFGRKVDVVGFDIHAEKILQLIEGYDATGELTVDQMNATNIEYTTDPEDLKNAGFFIVTVPTPIDKNNNPDLTPLEKASIAIGKNLTPGSIIVYESTVYPGVTEEVCIPILEQESGLKCGQDFKVGYSPERINPGDKVHTVEKILKVVSGMDEETLETVAQVYELVITAGVHRASSIKVAEAAKVIENTQRDLNIALINELSLIFDKLDISTQDVLSAAGTKWNFLKFTPGLVGGHCIGVDPYYLTHKAEQVGYQPQVILSGRRINDGMGKYIAEKTVKQMIRSGKVIRGARVLVLGLTFKEDVPDIRNTKVIDIVTELQDFGVDVSVHDPHADHSETKHEYGLDLVALEGLAPVDTVIYAVTHREFKGLAVEDLAHLCRNGNGAGVIVDVKSTLRRKDVEAAGLSYWSL